MIDQVVLRYKSDADIVANKLENQRRVTFLEHNVWGRTNCGEAILHERTDTIAMGRTDDGLSHQLRKRQHLLPSQRMLFREQRQNAVIEQGCPSNPITLDAIRRNDVINDAVCQI